MLEFLPRLFLIFLLIFLNGFFVASEFALVAVRKTRLKELSRKGNKRAEQVYNALKKLDIYISSTQLGITLASLALGWIGEPALAHFIEPILHILPTNIAAITAHSISVILAFSLITFLQIVFGELIPKNIALQKTVKTSLSIIGPLQFFTVIFKPFIIVLNSAGTMVMKLLGLHSTGERDSVHSEEEIKIILSQSVEKGILEKYEVDMVQKIFRFTDLSIQKTMTPRSKVLAFKSTETIYEIFNKIKKYDHTKFPIYKNDLDSIIGFMNIKDLYRLIGTPKGNYSIERTGIIKPIIVALETKPADEVLYEMRKKRVHIAVVKNSKNKTVGVVTLEDIVEDIVGEI